MHSVSLIIPCYNEELNIQKGVLDKIGNYVHHVPSIKEVIISDDGSTDNTKELIKREYLTEYPLFRLLENEHKGKAQTLISAILSAKGDYVLFTDIDLATPIEEVEKMLMEIEKNTDIVIGSRNNTRAGAPLTRKIMAVGFIFIRNFIIGLKNIKDTQCGFKAFRTEAAKKIISSLVVFKNTQGVEGSSVSAGFDLEFLFLATKLGYSITEIPVVWKHVETKNVNFITDTLETLQDIFSIKYYDITGAYKT
ncbi:MAG: glycosyltransferase [Candidatus Roizmanbacteria bacterium]|nr:glycosyltransferase [Candidatus Roizmanbacteria bacterium]